jgi:uncharacterized membrane protein
MIIEIILICTCLGLIIKTTKLNDRLLRVERITRIDPNTVAGAVRPPSVPVASMPQEPRSATWVAPVGGAPAGIAEHASAPAMSSTPVRTSSDEAAIGGTWFTAIGAIAVIVAAGFFLKYAFENDWITEPMRIALGMLAGAALFATGLALRKKYETYSGIVGGLGLALMYLSAFAASSLYDLWTIAATLTVTALISFVGAYAAIKVNSQLLVGVSIAGAFLTPLLLDFADVSAYSILAYTIIVSLGLVAATYRVMWKGAALLTVIGSYLLFIVWFSSVSMDPVATDYYASFLPSAIFLSLQMLIILGISLAHYFKHRSDSSEMDAAILICNAFGFLAALVIAAGDKWWDLMGPVTLALALLHGFIWLRVKGGEERASRFRYALGGICLAMFALYVPIEFDSFVVSIGWSLLAFVASVVAVKNDSPVARWFAGILYTLAFGRLLFYEAWLPIGDGYGAPLFNERVLVFAIDAAVAFASAWLLRTDGRSASRGLADLLTSYASVALFVLLGAEFDRLQGADIWLAMSASILAAAVIMFGARLGLQGTRVIGYIAFVIFALTLIDGMSDLTIRTFLINERTFAAVVYGIALAITALVLKSSSNVGGTERGVLPKAMALGVNILFIAALTADVADLFDGQSQAVAISILWLCYALLALIVGIMNRWLSVRWFAAVLLMIVVLKVFLFDTIGLDDFYRFLSYGALGVILLIVGYLYNRNRDRIEHFMKG